MSVLESYFQINKEEDIFQNSTRFFNEKSDFMQIREKSFWRISTES